MSIEIRQEANELVCDWGPFPYGDPRPERNQVGELILCTVDYAELLLREGPLPAPPCPLVTHNVTRAGDAMAAHVDHQGRPWTWILHPAHWWDDDGPPILVGRWPSL